MLLLIALIYFFIHRCNAKEIYGCDDGVVYLNLNEVAFYETYDFPLFMTATQAKKCDLTFFLANNNTNTSKVFTSFMQFSADPSASPMEHNFLTLNNLIFKIRDTFGAAHNPQSGIVIFEDNDEQCPLKSIINPIMLSNKNQIIHLNSNHYKNNKRKHSCFWQFAAPEGFGFKIVIVNFDVSSQTSLRIKNSTDLLINEKSVKINYPHYNSDTYFQIYLSNGNPDFIADIEFQAYITLIKKDEEKKQHFNCSLTQTSNLVTWSNSNSTYLNVTYKDNSQCDYDFVIRKNYAVIVRVSFLLTEPYADYIEYKIDEKDPTVIIPDEHYRIKQFVLESYINGGDKRVSWKFVSDGSVHFFGFIADFIFIHCQCATRFIECGANEFSLMNITYSINDFYCGNMHCNVTILPCPSKLIYVKIEFTYFVREHYDIFRLISNNVTVLDIRRQEQLTFSQYLNSENDNIFELITFSSPNVHGLKISTVSVKEPVFVNRITLSNNNPDVIIDLTVGSFVTIELDKPLIDQNVSLVIYAFSETITLYNDTTLFQPLSYCFIESSPNKCLIKDPSFVLNAIDFGVSAISLSSGSKNCVLKENHYINERVDLKVITGIANNDGPCILTILPNFYLYYITSLWTSATHENVKVFAGIDQTNLIFEFNSKTEKLFKNVYLTSYAHTIMIPKSKAVYITLQIADEVSTIAEYPYKSFFATPYYGTKKSVVEDAEAFVEYQVKEYPTKFTVINYEFSEGNTVSYVFGYNSYGVFFNKTGDSITIKNQDITFYYTDTTGDAKNGALFFVETLKDIR